MINKTLAIKVCRSTGFCPHFIKEGNVYRWEDNSRDKMPNVRYVNNIPEMPSVKFQVVYAKNN